MSQKNNIKMPTISKEDYLKIIYQQSETNNSVTTSAIAKTLNVSNAAATDMIQKLFAQGYLTYRKYKGVNLTSKGKKLALSLLRRHRLWELFLVKSLKLNWDEVHREAELLEHQTSEKLIDKIDEYLNYPKFDPHGAPIPDKYGKLPVEKDLTRLDNVFSEGTYFVAKVRDKDDELVRYFDELGLNIGTKFKVIKILNLDGSLTISNRKGKFSVSKVIAQNIFVSEVKK